MAEEFNLEEMLAGITPKEETARGVPSSDSKPKGPIGDDLKSKIKSVSPEDEEKIKSMIEVNVPEGTITDEIADEWKGEVEIKRVDYPDSPPIPPNVIASPFSSSNDHQFKILHTKKMIDYIIDKDIIKPEIIIQGLEQASIPVSIFNANGDKIVEWSADFPDIAEEVLMKILDTPESAEEFRTEVNRIIDDQIDSGVGKRAGRFYAEMCNYDKDLLTPITKLNAYFLSALEDTEPMQLMYMSKHIQLLQDISDKLDRLNDERGSD